MPDSPPDHWRMFFDLNVDGAEPVEMRALLRQGTQALTETWLYLFEPPLIAGANVSQLRGAGEPSIAVWLPRSCSTIAERSNPSPVPLQGRFDELV